MLACVLKYVTPVPEAPDSSTVEVDPHQGEGGSLLALALAPCLGAEGNPHLVEEGHASMVAEDPAMAYAS